ncbi:hypothetical protein DMB42_20035 [Nonomuraea sp. WAC 01424]|nr:hypothetical protein DMB42_20035 [Nonomuraea sp. WAC 01424]
MLDIGIENFEVFDICESIGQIGDCGSYLSAERIEVGPVLLPKSDDLLGGDVIKIGRQGDMKRQRGNFVA